MRAKFLFILILVSFNVITEKLKAQNQSPVIDVWQGPLQYFGQRGVPQKWINILGNVSDSDTVQSLSYTLNGGNSVSLSIGRDHRRLEHQGDFNIDIDKDLLTDGANQVVITAIDKLGATSSKSITLINSSGREWDPNYEISWDTVTNIQNVVQVVDGKWEKTTNGLKIMETGYDRLVAIGDLKWKEYEIAVPVTIHSLDPSLGLYGGKIYGLGVLMRWTGHSDKPLDVAGWQPKSGYLPLGNIGWITWERDDTSNTGLALFTGNEKVDFSPVMGETYMLKIRVESFQDIGHLYSMKAWKFGDAEPEPWSLFDLVDFGELGNGSLLLISHHVEATFGDIKIQPIDKNNQPFASFTILEQEDEKSFHFDASASSAPIGSIIAYNWDFTDGTRASGQVVDHVFSERGIYNVHLIVTDNEGNQNIKTQKIFIGDFTESNIKSDDFNAPELDTDLWTFVNPAGDGSYEMKGYDTGDANILMTVPEGTVHDFWETNMDAVKLLQPCNNTDFQVEAKFSADLNLEFQMQGIILQGSPDKYLRLDIHSNGSNLNIFVATLVNNQAEIIMDKTPIPKKDSIYLRLSRMGNMWNAEYSSTGTHWINAASFSFEIVAEKIGVYSGNAGASPPRQTAVIDYFFNTNDPIDPEDDRITGLNDEFDNALQFDLEQNFPNPFSWYTQFRFSIPERGNARMVIYDSRGVKVAEILNKTYVPGTYSKTWEPVGISPGLYFARMVLQAKHRYSSTIKVNILK